MRVEKKVAKKARRLSKKSLSLISPRKLVKLYSKSLVLYYINRSAEDKKVHKIMKKVIKRLEKVLNRVGVASSGSVGLGSFRMSAYAILKYPIKELVSKNFTEPYSQDGAKKVLNMMSFKERKSWKGKYSKWSGEKLVIYTPPKEKVVTRSDPITSTPVGRQYVITPPVNPRGTLPKRYQNLVSVINNSLFRSADGWGVQGLGTNNLSLSNINTLYQTLGMRVPRTSPVYFQRKSLLDYVVRETRDIIDVLRQRDATKIYDLKQPITILLKDALGT